MSTIPSKSDTDRPEGHAVLELLGSHASCRRYRDAPVPDDDIDRIVESAQRAATSSNLQLWSVVVVRREETRHRIAEIAGGQKQIITAPVFLAWCADRNRLDTVAAEQGYRQDTSTVEGFLVAAVDTAIAAQNAVVAAEALGYGTCYIGAVRNDTAAMIDLLGLPERVFPLFGMTVGVPLHPEGSIKPRLHIDAVRHREQYDPASLDLLTSYDRTMAETGIYEGRQQSGVRPDGSPAQPVTESEYGWMEHSARRTSRRRRPDMKEQILRQGYPLE